MTWASVLFKSPPGDGSCGHPGSGTIALKVDRALPWLSPAFIPVLAADSMDMLKNTVW